jgi:murein DD-endopeptidase MepM/ murein hydrolase activator NlpD
VSPSSTYAYQWPVKPFNRQHPIRGAFGDPRSLRGSIDPKIDNPLSFHDGVDIQVQDGTAVYAVQGGQISMFDRTALSVCTPFATPSAAVIFGYWHVDPIVHPGDYVTRSQLLGYVRPGAGHVHFSEKRFGIYVNPLRREGLSPYTDHTAPVIRSLIVYRAGSPEQLPLDAVTGRVDIAVDAYDPPAISPWGEWSGAIWSPARIRWSGLFNNLWRPRSGPPGTVSFDRLPGLSVRDVYAPGTLQNGPNFSGVYRFWLIRGVDTTPLLGVHKLSVTAEDTRGNGATRTFILNVVQ